VAEHARHRLREAAAHLTHKVRDASRTPCLPHWPRPRPTLSPPSWMPSPRPSRPTSDPCPASPHKPLHGDEEAAQEGRLLAAGRRARPTSSRCAPGRGGRVTGVRAGRQVTGGHDELRKRPVGMVPDGAPPCHPLSRSCHQLGGPSQT
jgi:hypothetical protein